MRLRAQLSCGAFIDITQAEPGMVLEFTLTPADGTEIEDTARIKDGILKLNATPESVIGIYQLLGLMMPRRRRWWKLWGKLDRRLTICFVCLAIIFLVKTIGYIIFHGH